jgi:hypothetical protein
MTNNGPFNHILNIEDYSPMTQHGSFGFAWTTMETFFVSDSLPFSIALHFLTGICSLAQLA